MSAMSPGSQMRWPAVQGVPYPIGQRSGHPRRWPARAGWLRPSGRTVDGMNQLLVLAYAVGGGVVGAGLNQYVTNIGQRRIARATVVGKVSEVEAIYAQTRWPGAESGDDDIARKLHLEMERCLHALEGAGLIAGIPRSTLSSYIVICRTLDTARRAESVLGAIGHEAGIYAKTKVGAYIESKGSDLSEDERAFAAKATEDIDKMLQDSIRPLLKDIENLEEENFDLHDLTLDALRASLWHPIISKLAWRKQRRLRQGNEKLERTRRKNFVLTQSSQVLKDRFTEQVDRLTALTGEPET